ncbi:MAG: M16 family metallopeptidase [Lactobacillus sp.]
MLNRTIKITPNDKFSTAAVGCFLRLPLTRHNLAYANLLTRSQLNMTLDYPTVSQQQRKLAEQYDLNFDAGIQLFGKQLIISYTLDLVEPSMVLDPAYTYESVITVFSNLVQHPYFDQRVIDLTKRQLAEEVSKLMTEPENVAYQQFFEHWYQATPDYADNLPATLAELENATPASFSKFSESLQTVPTVILGQARDAQQLQAICEKSFHQVGLSQPFASLEVTIPAESAYQTQVEVKHYLQSQLLLGYGYHGKMPFMAQVVGLVLADYLAGDQSSRLFVQVREQLGAAYEIDASCYANNSLLLIAAGLDQKQVPAAKALIQRELTRVQLGQIDSALLRKVKRGLLDLHVASADQQSWHLLQALRGELLPGYRKFDRLQAIKQVTPAKLKAFALNLFLNESYLLK